MIRVFGIAFLLCFTWPTASVAQNAPELGDLSDAIVARVNGKPLLLSELKEMALDLDVPAAKLRLEGIKGEGFRRAITALIDEELLVQAAQIDDIKVKDQDISRRVDGMIKRLVASAGGEESFGKFLKSSHLSLDSLRHALTEREKRRDLSAEVVGRRVKISSQDIAEFEKRQKDAGKSAIEVKVAQIFIRCPKDEQNGAEGKLRRQRALDAAREAGKNPQRFPQIAEQRSDDYAGRQRGGILGWVDPASLQPELQTRLAGMQVGEISEPVPSPTGYHVLYVMDRHDARDMLFGEKFEAARTQLIESLRSKAQIEIYPLKGSSKSG